MTAIDILWDMIPKDTQNYIIKQFNGLEKAKEMEKEQHEKTYNQSFMSNFPTFDDYYNETYGGNK